MLQPYLLFHLSDRVIHRRDLQVKTVTRLLSWEARETLWSSVENDVTCIWRLATFYWGDARLLCGHGDGSVVVMKKYWDGYSAVSVQMLISSVLDGGFGVWCCSLQLVLEQEVGVVVCEGLAVGSVW